MAPKIKRTRAVMVNMVLWIRAKELRAETEDLGLTAEPRSLVAAGELINRW